MSCRFDIYLVAKTSLLLEDTEVLKGKGVFLRTKGLGERIGTKGLGRKEFI